MFRAELAHSKYLTQLSFCPRDYLVVPGPLVSVISVSCTQSHMLPWSDASARVHVGLPVWKQEWASSTRLALLTQFMRAAVSIKGYPLTAKESVTPVMGPLAI